MTNNSILLIDDEKGVRNVLEIVLADKGYQVYTAQDGREALEICEKHCPGIIFVDMEMPGMNGLEMIARMKERWSGRQVVLITGHAESIVPDDLEAAGIFAVLVKPIGDADIQDVLARING